MTKAGPLVWRTGGGWLVLGGGGEIEALDATVLSWSNLDQPIAVLPTAGRSTHECEAVLDNYVDLGGPSGLVAPIFTAADAERNENAQILAESGLIHLADGPNAAKLIAALRESAAQSAMIYAFERGTTILGMGAGAVAFGAWAHNPTTGEDERGWGWLPSFIVEPHFTGAASSDRLQSLLERHPDCLGLGLPDQTALALGPDGRVVTLGEGEPTIVVSAASEDSA